MPDRIVHIRLIRSSLPPDDLPRLFGKDIAFKFR